jgi:NADH:ubiquinone oxidoreductase subunit 2 (subunit N)
LGFYLRYEGNIIDLLSVIFAWVIIAVIIVRIYRMQNAEERPKIWKIIIVVFLGLFSFSYTFPLFNEPFSIAILPLGVWILYGLLNRKERWEAYRKYAWTGFAGNFIFLGTALLAIGLAALFYPKDEARTYLTDVSGVELLVIHPSGEVAELDLARLDDDLSNFYV